MTSTRGGRNRQKRAPELRLMTLDELRFYLYRSRNKIDMLYTQLQRPKNASKITWKGKSRGAKKEQSGEEIDEKLDKVLQRLNEEGQIGSLFEQCPYIKATLPMRWGLYNDNGIRDPDVGPMVYFGYADEKVLLGMAGSSSNVEGMYGLTSTSSRSITPMVVEFLLRGMHTGERPSGYGHMSEGPTQHVYEGLALANYYLRGVEQTVEFVAKVIARDEQCRLRREKTLWGLGIIATPLYVAQTKPLAEDDDNDADKLGKRSDHGD